MQLDDFDLHLLQHIANNLLIHFNSSYSRYAQLIVEHIFTISNIQIQISNLQKQKYFLAVFDHQFQIQSERLFFALFLKH